MLPDAFAFYAAVILLLPMACFFLSAPTFLLVGLEIPEVTQLLRGISHGYFLAIAIAGVVAMVLFVATGRPLLAIGAVAITGFAIMVRRWLVPRMDAALLARDAGVPSAVRQLRVLHVKSMLLNAAQLVVVVAAVPAIP